MNEYNKTEIVLTDIENKLVQLPVWRGIEGGTSQGNRIKSYKLLYIKQIRYKDTLYGIWNSQYFIITLNGI